MKSDWRVNLTSYQGDSLLPYNSSSSNIMELHLGSQAAGVAQFCQVITNQLKKQLLAAIPVLTKSCKCARKSRDSNINSQPGSGSDLDNFNTSNSITYFLYLSLLPTNDYLNSRETICCE